VVAAERLGLFTVQGGTKGDCTEELLSVFSPSVPNRGFSFAPSASYSINTLGKQERRCLLSALLHVRLGNVCSP